MSLTREGASQIIHEARGLCWHKADAQNEDECVKCNHAFQHPNTYEPYICERDNPSYTSDWSAYGPFLEWAKAQGWWKDYKRWLMICDTDDIILDPYYGAISFAEFWLLKQKETACKKSAS